MGLRGPGAKPIKIDKETPISDEDCDFTWNDPGLERWERVVRFLEHLPITSGKFAGQKLKVRDWQIEIIKGIYGTDKRLVREAFISIPRKNGKTGLTAGLALCHFCGPESEKRGQVYSLATDREQAALIYEEMKAMILARPWMSARIAIKEFRKEMIDVPSESIYKALSAEPKSKHGFNTSCWIYDELAQSKNRNLYDVISTSTGAREEPLGIVISTQASDSNHIMSQLYDDAERWLNDANPSPSFYAYIKSAPQDADPWDEKVWFDCNPALNDFRSLEEMRDFAAKAKRIPQKETAFRLLYLNQRFTPLEHQWIPGKVWNTCRMSAEEIRELPARLKGARCYGGLDLSRKNDLTAFVLVFPFGDERVVLPMFWTTEENIEERGKRDQAQYELWCRQGHLLSTPGAVIDYEFVASEIADRTADFDLQEIACDRWNLDHFAEGAKKVGADHLKLFKHGQGFIDIDPAVRVMEDVVLKQQLKHNSNPIMDWCLDNVRIVIDAAGNRKFDKQKSKSLIDGVVALAMANNLCYSREAQGNFVDGELIII